MRNSLRRSGQLKGAAGEAGLEKSVRERSIRNRRKRIISEALVFTMEALGVAVETKNRVGSRDSARGSRRILKKGERLAVGPSSKRGASEEAPL